jgi:hypothetical protein
MLEGPPNPSTHQILDCSTCFLCGRLHSTICLLLAASWVWVLGKKNCMGLHMCYIGLSRATYETGCPIKDTVCPCTSCPPWIRNWGDIVFKIKVASPEWGIILSNLWIFLYFFKIPTPAPKWHWWFLTLLRKTIVIVAPTFHFWWREQCRWKQFITLHTGKWWNWSVFDW